MKTGKSYFCDMEQRIGFMSKRFGNVTLGEINEMLLSFIGKDMYLSFWEKENPRESIVAYKKHLDRLLKEDEKSDLSALCLTDERSIAKFVFEMILPYLHDEYSLSEKLCNFMKDFVYGLYDRFIHNELPILDYCSNFDSFHIQDYLEQAKQKYDLAFEKIRKRYKSLENFYVSFENDGTIKNTINAIRGHAKNPTWCNLEKTLNQVKNDRQITVLLVDAFILSNIYTSLHDKVKTNLIIGSQYYAKQNINNGIQYFFVDYGYKNDKSRADDILKTIEEQCPEAAEFYCNWFRGYHYVAKGKLKQAKDCYKKAFAARRFAGCLFETFIKQAVALSCYLDFNADKVRDSADQAKDSQSPLSADAKKFWNYGYAAGVFEQKAEETHQIVFRRVEIFKRYFNPQMFLNDSYSYLPFINVMCIPDEKALRNEYVKLTNLVERDINKRIRVMGIRPTRNLPITVAFFYINGCYSYGYYDLAKKIIDLVKDWLDKFDNLDFSLCSDKGCTIACDAIQQYKSLKLHKLDLDLTELKQNVMKIIEKSDSDSLTKNSLQKKRSALQEAIESFDIEIIKAVAEKINDIDNLRISADEESPAYYAISRYVCLYRYMNNSNFNLQDGNINLQNLDVPGLTKDDKNHFVKMLVSNPYFAETQKLFMQESYGKEEIWETELSEIKDVCLYLIEQTKEQDGYYMKTMDGNVITSLLFAAESNNVEICRKLILHNADPNICRPYTFLHRSIHWESWDVLEMYLNEFPDKAKVGINDHLQEKTPLSTFREKMENKYKEGERDYIMHIIDLFSKCGAC